MVLLKLYMETKKSIIEERSREVEDVSLDYYDDDGAHICLRYSANIVVDSMESLLADVEQLYGEIEGVTDIALGSPFQKIEDCERESEFTIKILLPLFRKLGFVNVKYNHGNKEFGKDVTFARRTEFDEYEYYGVQVKYLLNFIVWFADTLLYCDDLEREVLIEVLWKGQISLEMSM